MSNSRSLAAVGIVALLAATCSRGPQSPTAAPPAASVQDGAGSVGTHADGDIKNGPLDFVRIRVWQGTNGSIRGFYAEPGRTYNIVPNEPVELWVEWTTTAPAPDVPRLNITWGAPYGGDNIHCGPCRLTNRYAAGRYNVTVALDNRAGGTVSRTFTFDVSNPQTGGTFTFSNSTLINILDNQAASPYPSSINVNGVAGVISKVTATIIGYSHTFHSDLAVMLVGPTGQTLMLMNNSAGGADGNNANVTFEDGAAPFPNVNMGPGSFTFAPAGGSNPMVAPAPAGPFGPNLAVFNGTSPNGQWRLFVEDQAGADIGQIAGGWSITITTTGASSVGVVRASAGVVNSDQYPNDHILNYPFQKPDPLEDQQ